MMLIKRIEENEYQTKGELYIDDMLVCYTLELPDRNNQRRISRIPSGIYKVVKRNSKKYNDHFHILDVPNRDMILIHHGNYAVKKLSGIAGVGDTLGCILVGQNFKDLNGDGLCDVTNSKKTMNMLNDLLPDEFELVIE